METSFHIRIIGANAFIELKNAKMSYTIVLITDAVNYLAFEMTLKRD